MKAQRPSAHRPGTVVLVGLGNIGSQVVDHLGRMPGVKEVVLVDRDRYEPGNLRSQRITSRDVGQTKAQVQAAALRSVNPGLVIRPIVDDIANVPLGQLHGAVILAGLDSLQARLLLNERAWRLGVPWFDAGVEPGQHLVRVNGYLPGADHACMECSLEDADYQSLGTRHPCHAPAATTPPTNGATPLGALAAALLARECQRILAGDLSSPLIGRQVVIDTAHHRHYLTSFNRRPTCRFDHQTWNPAPLPGITLADTLGDLLEAARHRARAGLRSALTFDLHPLAPLFHCPHCGRIVHRLHLAARVNLRCPGCGRSGLLPSGFDEIHRIDSETPRRLLHRRLARLGFRGGDVIGLKTARRTHHFVIPHEGL